MNGFELYNKIKKIDSQLKACFITAAGKMYYDEFRNKKEKQYCELNKDIFLRKPISNRNLVKEINKIMTMNQKIERNF